LIHFYKRVFFKMIVLFLSLLLLQCSLADNKACRKKFGKDYEALTIVDGACKYTKSCLKCTKGFKLEQGQYCVPKNPSYAGPNLEEEIDNDPCLTQFGTNYTTCMYTGACIFQRCFLCLNGGKIELGDNGPECVPQPVPQSEERRRRRRSVTTKSPAAVHQQSSTEAPLSRTASAPLPPNLYPYPRPPPYWYPSTPRSFYLPPYGYPTPPLGGLGLDPMMLLFLSGELGGSSADNTFSKLIALQQFGNLGGRGLQGIPPSHLALSGIGGFGGNDPASLALTGYLSPYGGIDPSSLFLQRYMRNQRH